MRIKLQIVETITHYVTVLAEEGEDGFGLLEMTAKEQHDQIEHIKHMDVKHHKACNTQVDTEIEQRLVSWDIEE